MSLRSRTFSRRSLLAGSARAAGLAVAALPWAPLLAAAPGRGFKIGALDGILGKHFNPAVFDVAKQIGLDGVQVDIGGPSNGTPLLRPEVQKEYLAAAKRTGLEIASLTLGVLNELPLKSDPRAAQFISESVDACKALGLRVVLVPQFGPGELDMRKTAEIGHAVKMLKAAAPKAETQGVLLGLENYLSAEDNMRIIERVGSPAVTVYYDVGNSTDKGRNVYKEIRTLGKLICEFHFKDGKYLIGHGRIDFKQVRKAIDTIGYRGWIQIEAAAPHGVVPDYTTQCRYLKGIFPRTG